MMFTHLKDVCVCKKYFHNLVRFLSFRVIECKGPTNTRVYTVAVYFQGKRLAKASGHSIQEAEMNSAKEALEKSQGMLCTYKMIK